MLRVAGWACGTGSITGLQDGLQAGLRPDEPFMALWPTLPMKDVVDGYERPLSPSPSPRGGGEVCPTQEPTPVPGKKTAAARCGGLSPSPSPQGEGSIVSRCRDFHGNVSGLSHRSTISV